MTRLLTCYLGLALVVTSSARASDSKEPTYGDKTLTQWLKRWTTRIVRSSSVPWKRSSTWARPLAPRCLR